MKKLRLETLSFVLATFNMSSPFGELFPQYRGREIRILHDYPRVLHNVQHAGRKSLA